MARASALGLAGAALVILAWPFSLGGALLLACAAFLALKAVWMWERTRVVVTSEKVFLVQGTWRRRATAVRLGTIQAVELEQSLPGQLLGYGTVVVGPLALEHVAEPRRVCGLVERLAL
jgi:uncharacterized membrane protein YdbT with pleckstrin-like domain